MTLARSRQADDPATQRSSPRSCQSPAAGTSPRDSPQLAYLVNQQIVIRIPTSSVDRLKSALVHHLDTADIRHDLTCYGAFLRYLPGRLGKNPALDAAITCMTTSFPTRLGADISPEMLDSYGRALGELRTVMGDPVTAHEIETVCAIYLIMIAQSWVSQGDGCYSRHTEAIAMVLEALSTRKFTSKLEIEILVTMTFPVIIESISNPRIKLRPWYTRLVDNCDPNPQPDKKASPQEPPPRPIHKPRAKEGLPSMRLEHLAQLSEYIRNPGPNLEEISESYQQLKEDASKVRIFLAQVAPPPHLTATVPTAGPGARAIFDQLVMYRNFQSAYSLILSLLILLHEILLQADPNNPTLIHDTPVFEDEIIAAAEATATYRPLGANHIAPALVVAWANTQVAEKKAKLEELLEGVTVFGRSGWKASAIDWKSKFDKLRYSSAVESPRDEYLV